MSRRKHGEWGIIYADPPWKHRDQAAAGERGARFKYPTMPTEDICRLRVADLAARDCALFMWAVPPMIGDALAVMSAWGFRLSTFAFVWVKTTPAVARRRARHALQDAGLDRRLQRRVLDSLQASKTLHPGHGVYMGASTRANVEVVLLGIKGRLGRVDAGVRQLVEAPPGRHSEKPAEVRDRIVRLLGSDRPRLELFARERVEGWACHGNDPALGTPDVELAMAGPVLPSGAPTIDPRQLSLLDFCRGR